MKKIKNYIFRLLYALPFGLKRADEEITAGNGSSDGEGVVINQQVEDKTVAKHLLKGEITQAVEELRYRTYKVDEESQNYEYLGNGVAVKKEEKKKNKTKFKFTQQNKLIVTGVLDELEHIDSYGTENYTLEIMYNSYPRFRMEEFADRIIVSVNTTTKEFYTTLVFPLLPNKYNPKSRPFINELQKLQTIDLSSEYAVNHNDLLSLNSISFSTYKADGEDNFTNYSFSTNCNVQKINFDSQECFITYKWDDMIRLPLGKLSEKYSSQSMELKYESHEEKEADSTLEEYHKENICEICGKPFTTSKIPHICDSCLEKMTHK